MNKYEVETITLMIDIKPFSINDHYTRYIKDTWHLDYTVLRDEYEKNKNKILKEICYNLKFKRYNMPPEIQNADVLIVIDRHTEKILDIIMQGFVHKEWLKGLTEIDNIDYLHFKLKNIIGEENE